MQLFELHVFPPVHTLLVQVLVPGQLFGAQLFPLQVSPLLHVLFPVHWFGLQALLLEQLLPFAHALPAPPVHPCELPLQ